MKILVTILTALLLVASIGLGFGLYTMDTDDAKKINSSIEDLKASLGEEVDEATKDEFIADQLKELELPSPSTFNTAKIFAILVMLFGLITLIGYFMNLPQLKIIIGLLVLFAIISIVLHPAYDKGSLGSASNDKVAMAHSGIAIAGALLAFLGQRLKNKTVA